MPCNSEHIEPTAAEKHRKEAAELMLYVNRSTGRNIPRALEDAAQNNYQPDNNLWVTELCSWLKNTYASDSELFEKIVYNAHSPSSRRLADWWERHKAMDDERFRKQAAEAYNTWRGNEGVVATSPTTWLTFLAGYTAGVNSK